jgi:hypothetical protein
VFRLEILQRKEIYILLHVMGVFEQTEIIRFTYLFVLYLMILPVTQSVLRRMIE